MPFEVELEELRQLQAIMARHEDHAFKVRNVMYALLTALAVPLFSEKKVLPGKSFLIMSGIVILLFLCVELVHRAFVRLAILRSLRLEEALRKKETYDGPLIGISLGQKLLINMMINEISMPYIWVHYASLIFSVLAIAAVMW